MHVLVHFLISIIFFSTLNLRCEADPSALARYVLALLKKEKLENELLHCMNEQLDVFLGKETGPFLVRLFDIIKSEEYLNAVESTSQLQLPESNKPTSIVDQIVETVTKANRECTPPMSATEVLRMIFILLCNFYLIFCLFQLTEQGKRRYFN